MLELYHGDGQQAVLLHGSLSAVLNLNYNFIERIDGHELEHLYNLRQLHLDFNKLSSLPINLMRRFTSLDQLSLAGNF